ncbi:MAG: hypothetical protein ACTSW7_00815 [Candidatus Thorarchaeota archaeon]|nr:hypothetical protein [Thermoplasmatales archaeon]
MKPKMTCEFTKVVDIAFSGYRLPEDKHTMRVPRDEGMLEKIYDFMKEHNIYPATRGGASGGGIYIHSFFEDDAMKIVDFLDSQGVRCTEIVKGQ